jgi:hypothetical protein
MWEVFAGDCLPITIAALDENEDPVDLTGYTFSLEVKWEQDRPSAADALFGTESAARNTITLTPTVDAENGLITAELTGDQTEELAKGKRNSVYLRWTEPDESCVRTELIGKIRVRQ